MDSVSSQAVDDDLLVFRQVGAQRHPLAQLRVDAGGCGGRRPSGGRAISRKPSWRANPANTHKCQSCARGHTYQSRTLELWISGNADLLQHTHTHKTHNKCAKLASPTSATPAPMAGRLRQTQAHRGRSRPWRSPCGAAPRASRPGGWTSSASTGRRNSSPRPRSPAGSVAASAAKPTAATGALARWTAPTAAGRRPQSGDWVRD